MGRLTADLQISAFVNKHVKYTRNVQLSDVIQYSFIKSDRFAQMDLAQIIAPNHI